jgi:hypothetical protein
MDDLTSAIPALESLFSRARSLRSPFSIAEHGRPIDFNAEKTMVASQLNSRLRGVSSEWVRRGQGQLAVQQLLRVCASEIAMAVEAASEPSMHELSSLTMQLSSMQTNVATQLFSLLSNCAQVAAAERLSSREQLRRAELETVELLDAAEMLERQMRLSSEERSSNSASSAAREAHLKSHVAQLEQRYRPDISSSRQTSPSAPRTLTAPATLATTLATGAVVNASCVPTAPPHALSAIPSPITAASIWREALSADGEAPAGADQGVAPSPARAFGLPPSAFASGSATLGMHATEAGVAVNSWGSPRLPGSTNISTHGPIAPTASMLPASVGAPAAAEQEATATAASVAAAVVAAATAQAAAANSMATATLAADAHIPLLPALVDTAELLRSSRAALEEAQRMSVEWEARDAAKAAHAPARRADVANGASAWPEAARALASDFGGAGGGARENAEAGAHYGAHSHAAECATVDGASPTRSPSSVRYGAPSAARTPPGAAASTLTALKMAPNGGSALACSLSSSGKPPGRVGSTMTGYLSSGGGGRNLSLRQMRELIEEMYASKAKHDAKTDRMKLPRETLAQHLTTFLTARYGLKMLIAENAQACFDGIREYQEVDADVATFGCVLRHEVEEGFVEVQRQLKHTVGELLRVQLRGRMTSKADIQISHELKKKQEGHLAEDEWTDIVKYLYTEADVAGISQRMREAARRDRTAAARVVTQPVVVPGTPRAAAAARARAAEAVAAAAHRLPYAAFLQELLEFQLAGHLTYLAPFVALFRGLDLQARGVLDDRGFRALVANIDPRLDDATIGAMLEQVDPHSHQRISFSDCVYVLSDPIERMHRKRKERVFVGHGGQNAAGA